jgi:hypothetical protein
LFIFKIGEKDEKDYFFILVSLLFVSIYSKTISCPDGWFSRTIIVTGYPGCDELKAEVCIKCSPLGNQMEVRYTTITGCDGGNLRSYIDYLDGYILSNYSLYCVGDWTPCPEKVRIIIRRPLCFVQDPDDQSDFHYCDESWCRQDLLVCTRADGTVDWGEPVYTAIEGNPYPGCLARTWPPDPPLTCFHVSTPCR